MGEKRLSGVSIKRESESYIDALYAVLNKANYFDGPKYRLNGMTGIAFKFISHKRMIPPSPYMYPLDTDSWKAVDRLGVYNEIYWGFKSNPTFPLYQNKAIGRIKESIDKDIPALFWEPDGTGFAVINGYNEEDEVFFYQDRHHKEDQIMLFNNVGKVGAAFWMFQVIGDRTEKDIRDIYIDSMECCVDEWEISDNIAAFAKYEFGCGRNAYDYIITALEANCFSELGALIILNKAIGSKEHTYLYFQEIKNEFEGIGEIAGQYKNVSDIFGGIGEIIPKSFNSNTKIDRNRMSSLIDYLREAKKEEEQAVQALKLFLRETLYNRHIDYYDVKKFI